MAKKFNRGKTLEIKIGQTLVSNDLYLPYNKGRVPNSKERPVIVADKNRFNELAVIPGSTQKTPHTTYYGRYGIKYYRHNLEIKDNDGKSIKYGKKFYKDKRCTNIPLGEVERIRDSVINHSKFSSENRRKYNEFLQKKTRD